MRSRTVKKKSELEAQTVIHASCGFFFVFVCFVFLRFPGLTVLSLQSQSSLQMVQDECRSSVWSCVKVLRSRNFGLECMSTTERLNYGYGSLPRLGREDYGSIEATLLS